MQNDIKRLKRMVENDEDGEVRRALTVLRSDVCRVLSDFMDVKDMEISVKREENGYALTFNVRADRIFGVGSTSDTGEL